MAGYDAIILSAFAATLSSNADDLISRFFILIPAMRGSPTESDFVMPSGGSPFFDVADLFKFVFVLGLVISYFLLGLVALRADDTVSSLLFIIWYMCSLRFFSAKYVPSRSNKSTKEVNDPIILTVICYTASAAALSMNLTARVLSRSLLPPVAIILRILGILMTLFSGWSERLAALVACNLCSDSFCWFSAVEQCLSRFTISVDLRITESKVLFILTVALSKSGKL